MVNVMIQSERYEDALVTIKGFVSSKLENQEKGDAGPKEDELSLLLTSFRRVCDKKVSSWKSLERCLQNEPKGSIQADKILNYISKLEDEIITICHEAIRLGTHLISLHSSNVPVVCRLLGYKIQADYMRYLLKITPECQRSDSPSKILELYKTARALAEEKLPPCHHLSLQLALDLSTIYFKVFNRSTEARDVASKAFDSAIKVMNDVTQSVDKYSESIVILQRIRDLITLLKAS